MSRPKWVEDFKANPPQDIKPVTEHMQKKMDRSTAPDVKKKNAKAQ